MRIVGLEVRPEFIGVDAYVFISLSAYVYLFATWDFVVVVSFVYKISLARMSCHRVAASFVQILSIIEIERSKALSGPCRSTPGGSLFQQWICVMLIRILWSILVCRWGTFSLRRLHQGSRWILLNFHVCKSFRKTKLTKKSDALYRTGCCVT